MIELGYYKQVKEKEETKLPDLIDKKDVIEAVYQALREPSNSDTWIRVRNAIENIKPVNIVL